MMSLNIAHLAPADSYLARYDPRWRLATFALAIGAVAPLRSLSASGLALAFSLLLAGIGGVPTRWLLARIVLVLAALSPFLLILPLTVNRGGPAMQVWGIHFSFDGVIAAGALVAKALSIVTLSLTVLASAPLHATLRAARHLRAPGILVHLALLSYRYVFLLLDELNRLRLAVRVRGFRNRADRHSYRTVGQIAGTLLVRGAERAERVAQAMRCRGFDGQFRGLDEFRTHRQDVLLSGLIVALFAALVAWDVAAAS